MGNLSWMQENMENIYQNNWLYKIACFLLFLNKRKMTYEEFYLLLSRLNEKNMGEEDAKRYAIVETIKNYIFNNNKVPEKWDKND